VASIRDNDPLGRAIGRTHKFVRAWGDRELAAIGSSVTEWMVLHHIANTPDPGASQTEVARFTDMGGPALVRHLDRLEAEGIVVRTRDAHDRRIIRLSLTDAGADRLESARQVMARCDEQLRRRLTAEQARVMVDALDHLFEFALGELQQGAPPPGFQLTGPPPAGFGPSLAPPTPTPRSRTRRRTTT
jgi:MarR family transcriptional regulator for hemolysin